MTLTNKNNIICLGESELVQWIARGSIHILKERIFFSYPSNGDLSFFASAPFFKIDDAKARVIVKLNGNWSSDQNSHRACRERNVVNVPAEAIEEVAPIIGQHKHRLENIGLKMADWNAENEWNDWLINQGALERSTIVIKNLRRLGFLEHDFFQNEDDLFILTKFALRPSEYKPAHDRKINAWGKFLSYRDQIMKDMRFEGHCDQTSFLQYSILRYLELNYPTIDTDLNLVDDIEKREGGWIFKDLTAEVISKIHQTQNLIHEENPDEIPLLVLASYLRIFDELIYGQKDWNLIFNLIRFNKYSISKVDSDYLIYLTLTALSTEELVKDTFLINELAP